jgi:glycosyltransferase involved in cell wall biosynthesis
VPTGLDLERYSAGDQRAARAELGITGENFVVGVVATLRSWKGHRYLVEAFAAQARKNWQLLIVGGGPGEENLRRQVSDLGIKDKVLMPGNQSDVLPWLRAMDIFALPSYANEGVPQAIMQAQACGIPVISTDVGSITELIAHNETGMLVTPKDIDSLGAAIVRLAGDEVLRRRLAEAARQQARQRYSDRLMIERMTDVFRSVTAAGAS